jgi:hypothetical protein
MPKNQDAKMVAKTQAYEINYICKRYNVPKQAVKDAIAKVGRSRRKIYAELRLQGFNIDTKTRKKK